MKKIDILFRAARWQWMAMSLHLLLSSAPMKAQNTLHTETNAKLNTRIHLPSGKTTLAAVTDALSKQVGMKIEAVDFLQERRLALALVNGTARDVLNGLAELNNWRWFETETGSILLTVQRPILPERLPDLPRALQTALTKDFRRYLGIGIPLADLIADSRTMETEQRTRSALKTSEDKHREEILNRTLTSLRLQAKIYYLSWRSDRQLGLLHSLEPGILDGREVPVGSLSTSQQETLRRALVAWALNSFTNPGAYELFNSYLRPYEIDPRVAIIQLEKNGTLSLGSKDAQGNLTTGLMQKVPLPPDANTH